MLSTVYPLSIVKLVVVPSPVKFFVVTTKGYPTPAGP